MGESSTWKAAIGLALCLTPFLFSCRQGVPGRIEILVSPKAVAASFWLEVREGAMQAAKETQVTVHWKGPAMETDIAGQIAILEDYVHQRIDAIVFAACDEKALIPAVEKAAAAGIPVISIDSGIESDIPASLIATDNLLGGRKAADCLAELLNGSGTVACIPIVPGAATSNQRERGFRDGIATHPGLKLVASQHNESDIAIAMAVTENILTAHPDLAGLFAASESGTIGASRALVGRGMAGRVALVGFDAASSEIEALENGIIDALIVQNPYRMGYDGVRAAVDVIHGKQVERRIDTGVAVVTRRNLHDPDIQKMIVPNSQSE